MAAVNRWVFFSPVTNETWTVPINPNKMDKIGPTKVVSYMTTTAINGQVLSFEGAPVPTDWTFSGAILYEDHYRGLEHWTYEVPGRIQITDHFLRVHLVQLLDFDATPGQRASHPWYHTYTVKGKMIIPGALPS